MNQNEFINELKKIDIILTNDQLKQLDTYYQLLRKWNEKINLTRIIEEKDVYLKHFYDSITISKVVDLHKNISICDIGTGAGFPGIVLKIVFPNLKVTLVDSLLKRIKFLNIVIDELKLENIQTFHARAEDYVKNNQKKFDIVTCRAVSKLINLLPYSIPLITDNGFFIPMKANCDEEIQEAESLLKKMKLVIKCKEEFNLPIENSHRTILKIAKK